MTGSREAVSFEDRQLQARAAAWEQCSTLLDCTPTRLQEVVRSHGLDFATALLYDRVMRVADNQSWYQRVIGSGRCVCGDETLVGIVPGAFYREHKNTGADGARLAAIAKGMNCPCELIPVKSFGSLASNAAIISDWLSRHRRRRVVLVSLSKGSADVKTALSMSQPAERFDPVVAWLSLSGLPQGTPLITWLRRQPLRRLGVRLLLRIRGHRYSVVEELRPEADGPLANWPTVPRHLRVVHVVAFPLRRHLAHPWAERAYERVAPWGPNDGGGFLLADVCRLPGAIVPIWGADHYLQPAWDTTPMLGRLLAEVVTASA